MIFSTSSLVPFGNSESKNLIYFDLLRAVIKIKLNANGNSRRNHRRGNMFKLTTELIKISHFSVLEADHFTVQLKEGFIQESKKALKVDAILSVYGMRFVT